ncbi:PAS-domain containing protein [Belnapia sp. T18]|uniref:histidine kinase n=1 Tax=Belnapia arida TaxID=2804533 RepID=A0ABS1U6Y2_9PROT|nr:PAS-domain containing protein [Belnapia arida]MBL6080427.1 PAS-domain containing protein [Belnapia arida]
MIEGETAIVPCANEGALLQLVLDSMRHGIALFDAEDRLVAANELARRLGAIPGDTLPIGANLMTIVLAQAAAGEFGDAEAVEQRIASTRSFDRRAPHRYTRTRPDGTVLEVAADPTPDGGFIVTYSDITARARAEQAARDRAALLSAALDSMQHGCLIYGPDDRLLAANALAASSAGLAPEELVPGRPRAELIALQHARGAFGSGEAAATERDRLLQRPAGGYNEITRSTPNGRVVKVASNPIGPDGAGGHVVTYTDITPIAQAEAASRARAELLQTMQETMRHGIALFGPDQRLIVANDLAAELAGLRPEEMPPGTTPAGIAALQRARGLFGEEPEAVSSHDRNRPRALRRRLHDGRIVDVRSDPTPDGGFVITWSDVTPLIEAEKAAEARAATLQAMIENMRHGVALFDPEGWAVAANRLIHDLAGLPDGMTVPGRHISELITAQRDASASGDPTLDAMHASQALAADRSKPQRHTRPSRDGRMLDVASDPMPDGGFVITITDITALTRAEAELRQRAELQEAMLHAIRHGIALYDADHRLIAVKRLGSGQGSLPFPEGDGPMPPGTSMVDILRRQAAIGGLGPEPERELQRLLALDRREPHRYMRRTSDGRLIEIHSDPMPDGGFSIAFADVTPLAQAEQEAHSRAAMLRAALDTMRHGFMLFGPDRRLLISNRLASEIGGLSAEELAPGTSLDDQLRRQHARGMYGAPPESDETLTRLLAADRSQSWRRTRHMPDGQVVEVFSDPTPDGGFVVTFTDITARAEAEAEAKSRARDLQVTLDSVRHGIALYGPDRRLILANRLAGPHHGLPGLPGRTGTLFDDILREQYALGHFGPEPEASRRYATALGRDRSQPARIQRRMQDGRVIDIASDPTPDGGFVITQSDVTALEEAKAESSDRATTLQLMLDNIRHGISYFGPDRRLIACNRLAEELVGEDGRVPLRPGDSLETIVDRSAVVGSFGTAEETAAIKQARIHLDRSKPDRYLRRTGGGRLVEISSNPAPNGGFVVTHSDVTELLEAQEAAAARGAQIQLMMDSMLHGIALFDRKHRLVTANLLAARLNGLDAAAFEPGRAWSEVVADISAAGLLDAGEIPRIVADDYSRPLRFVRPGADGRVIEVTTNPTPEGGFVTTYTDITALTRAEAAARERAGVLQVMLENTRHGICYYGPDRRVIAANALAAEFGRYSPGTLRPGRSIEELVEDQLARGVGGESGARAAQLALDMDRSQPSRYTRPTADGHIIEVTSDPTPGGGFVVTTADITPLVRAEEEARSRAAILQAMLDNSRQGIILFDMVGRVVAANGIAATLNGLPPDAIWPGRPIQALIQLQADNGDLDAAAFADALAMVPQDRPWTVPSTHLRTLNGRKVEITTDGVGCVGYIRSYRDTTDELRARAELERARDAAEAANRAKSRFLATMSHELRTPLNAVIGFSEAYLIDSDPARRLDYVQSIHEAGRHLLSLIDDILDVTRSETTGFQITEGHVAVLPLAEGAVQMMQATAATTGITLGAALPQRLPLLRADELRLRQVLLNLLANAVKFTPSGGSVTLGAEIAPEGDLVLKVSDTGIGIAAADIPRAFEPFTQLDSSLSRRFPGSGLGLYLSRALAEAQGATLTLESKPGQGTTALLRFPKDRLLADLAA